MIHGLSDLRLLLRGCLRQIAFTLVLSTISGVLDVVCMLALPAFLLVALSGSAQAVPWGAWLAPLSMPQLSALVAGLFILRAGYMMLVGAALARLAESVRERIVRRLVQSFAGRPYQDAIATPAATAITVSTNYVSTFSLHVVLPLLRLIQDGLTIVAVLAVVAVLELRLMLVVLAALAAVALFYDATIKRINDEKSRQMARLERALTHDVSQVIGAPREVRVLGLGEYFTGRVGATLRAMTRARAWLGAIYWFPRALGELTLIGLGVAYMVIRAWSGADAVAIVSNLSALAFAGLRLLPAFAQTLANLSFIRGGRHVTAQVAAQLRPFPSPARPAADQADGPLASIELVGVSFQYAGAAAPALADVSLALRRGESVGVIGPSGAGKSTLADVLLGLLRPTAGTIRVNGREVDLCDEAWWRRVAFVPQGPYLANDTVLRNVAFGIPDDQVDRGRVADALRRARLDQVVAALPQGVDTMLGDHGVGLSGGERQRLAMARALYRRSEFLVLDEATSALDDATERDIIETVAALKGDVTLFIIAHRVSTLASCDLVIELRGGRLQQQAA